MVGEEHNRMEEESMSSMMPANLERSGSSGSDVFKSKERAAVGMKAFFNLMGLWRLKNEDMITLLGEPSQRTFFNWKAGKVSNVSADTMRRIGYLLGIHKALRLLFHNPENVYGWVSRDNEDFGGQSPLRRMIGGDVTDLAHVRRYLDAMRGGWV